MKVRGGISSPTPNCRRACEISFAPRDIAPPTFKSSGEHARDIDIWKRGHLEQAVIAAKDKDFASLAISRLDACRIIFVRIGNLRRGALLAKFESVMQNLVQALDSGDKIIEIT